MSPDERPGVLTTRELMQIIRATLEGRPEAVSEEEVLRVCNWAVKAKTDALLLEGVLRGRFHVRAAEGADVEFKLVGNSWDQAR